MQEFIIDIMNRFGYVGVAFLIALENVFPPIPSEVILTFGGFMTTQAKLNLFFVILSATVGSLIGSFILYFFGRIFSLERTLSILNGRWGRILRIKSEHIEKSYYWFHKKGEWTVFFCRFVPIVRSLISIPAGMSKMSIFSFMILTFFGSLIWNMVLVLLGFFMGEQWEMIVYYVNRYSILILIVFILLLLGISYYFLIYKKKKNDKN